MRFGREWELVMSCMSRKVGLSLSRERFESIQLASTCERCQTNASTSSRTSWQANHPPGTCTHWFSEEWTLCRASEAILSTCHSSFFDSFSLQTPVIGNRASWNQCKAYKGSMQSLGFAFKAGRNGTADANLMDNLTLHYQTTG